jgi:hypothetical protein
VDANVDVAGGFAQRVARPLEVGHAAGCKLEVATFGGKRLRNCKSDAFTRSSDERALSLQPQVHRRPPSANAHGGASLRRHQSGRALHDQ